MSDEALLVARVLFWVASAGVAFLPMRWALFCFIFASHLDITSLTFTSASSVGFENTFRIVALPLFLLARTNSLSFANFKWLLPHKLWIALTIYVAIAGFWGGFPLSAVKLIAYLCAYLVLYFVFTRAWEAGWLDITLLRQASWSVIALAILQTFSLGNGWGGAEMRFTSFSTPQYFAAFLVAMLAILVFSGERGWWHYTTCGAIVVSIVLNGSRYVFISTVLLLIVASFRVHGSSESFRLSLSKKRVLVTLVLAIAIGAALISYAPENRLDQLLVTASDQDAKLEEVGTFSWRLGIYQEIFDRLEKRTFTQLFFGSGTGSGAELMIAYEPTLNDKQSIDANRALHSEYLRALYEWGILGLLVLIAFLTSMILGFARKIAADGGGVGLAFLGVLPSILLGLAIENILAGAASAAGVGILLAMSFAYQTDPAYFAELSEEEEFSQTNVQAAEHGGHRPDDHLLSI
jgi:hypothetical protein